MVIYPIQKRYPGKYNVGVQSSGRRVCSSVKKKLLSHKRRLVHLGITAHKLPAAS